jgi:poly(A) polymerase
MRLRWTIKKQAFLLEPVSPSRLTEELSKIIHSPYAAPIIKNLEVYGLYKHIQPNASRLMRESENFRLRYMKSLEAQNGGVIKPGEALAALIRDYLEDFVDWNAEGITENYRNAFMGARKFVLPINPPRMELDQAVRLIFAEHGQNVKKIRFLERGKSRSQETEALTTDFPDPPAAVAGEGAPKRRRRRRHKPRSNTS